MARFRWYPVPVVMAPTVTLCLSEEDFLLAQKQLELADVERNWLDTDADGCAHAYQQGDTWAVLVCTRPDVPLDSRQLPRKYGLLVHEAVHACYRIADAYRGMKLDEEMMANAVQATAQALIYEYNRRMTAPRKGQHVNTKS
jgi:ribosomal protein S18 acetylase RimI-like enzyme